MLWIYQVFTAIINIFTVTATESNVYRRQILSTKVDPRAVGVNAP